MRKNIGLLFLFVSLFAQTSFSQKIATLQVELTTPSGGLAVPVKTDLDALTFLPDTLLNLVEVRGNKRTPVPFQIENEQQRILHWLIDSTGDTKKYVFELIRATSKTTPNNIETKDDGATLTLAAKDRNLLRYQYTTLYPPEGIDTAYKRSGFIHPLWSPHGQVLTRIQAPDHYHHYGIWNPWTEALFEGDSVDFWNLARKQGTVRFAKFIATHSGPVFGEYAALHEHVVFQKNTREKVALHEVQSVRIYRPTHNDYYIADITIRMNCATESPVLLLQYRYGGLGWRTTEQWNKDNSTVLTSEGKTRKDADGTKARWCIVQGALDNDHAGVAMLSYPTNYNHPEPLRIWPENMYDRGDMFANFSPTKNKSWMLHPGKTYTLKYRFIVFNGHFTKEKAEHAWEYFSTPPRVIIKRH